MTQNSLEKLVYEQTAQLRLLEASIRADKERLEAERQIEKERFREWREQFDADTIKEQQHARERHQADLEKMESDRKANLGRLESERKAGLEKLQIELDHQTALHEARMAEAARVNNETLRKVDRLFTTTILTGISSALTVLLGVGAINAAIANNMLASYNGGKDHATWEAQIQQELREHQATLLQIQKRLDQRPPPQP